MKTATAKAAIGFRNILFATDFSPAAAQAIPYVKKIAKHYDAALVALHVRTPVVNPMTEPATWPIYLEAAKAQDEQHRGELLDAFAGIPTQVLIEEGSIETCLKEAIEKNDTRSGGHRHTRTHGSRKTTARFRGRRNFSGRAVPSAHRRAASL